MEVPSAPALPSWRLAMTAARWSKQSRILGGGFAGASPAASAHAGHALESKLIEPHQHGGDQRSGHAHLEVGHDGGELFADRWDIGQGSAEDRQRDDRDR